MKKAYKSPKSCVINIDSEELICESPVKVIYGGEADSGYGDGDSDGLSKMLNIVNMGDDEAMSWE